MCYNVQIYVPVREWSHLIEWRFIEWSSFRGIVRGINSQNFSWNWNEKIKGKIRIKMKHVDQEIFGFRVLIETKWKLEILKRLSMKPVWNNLSMKRDSMKPDSTKWDSMKWYPPSQSGLTIFSLSLKFALCSLSVPKFSEK